MKVVWLAVLMACCLVGRLAELSVELMDIRTAVQLVDSSVCWLAVSTVNQ